MTEAEPARNLEKYIGYTFYNPTILEEALTRRAHLNENPTPDEMCMNPLATLGDAVLDTISVNRLYEKGIRTVKELTECKISEVRRERTHSFADQHKLGKYVHWGKGEDKNEIWDKSDRALDAVTEALIGAVYLDAQRNGMNGMTVVNDMLERMKFF